MPAPKPTIYVIAGCNGAGKTTFAREFLPKEVKCLRFLNADEIARGLSPFDPGPAAVRAARLLLTEFRSCVERHQTFALESTLSGRTCISMFLRARDRGFAIRIHYLWLPTAALAIARVRERVKKGGHNVPARDVRRRFQRSRMHFANDYAALADRWAVWDNQTSPPSVAARRIRNLPARSTGSYPARAMKKNGHDLPGKDDFIAPARRAFIRVARKLRQENARLGLPLVTGSPGQRISTRLKTSR